MKKLEVMACKLDASHLWESTDLAAAGGKIYNIFLYERSLRKGNADGLECYETFHAETIPAIWPKDSEKERILADVVLLSATAKTPFTSLIPVELIDGLSVSCNADFPVELDTCDISTFKSERDRIHQEMKDLTVVYRDDPYFI